MNTEIAETWNRETRGSPDIFYVQNQREEEKILVEWQQKDLKSKEEVEKLFKWAVNGGDISFDSWRW